jgi:hypothetical protein
MEMCPFSPRYTHFSPNTFLSIPTPPSLSQRLSPSPRLFLSLNTSSSLSIYLPPYLSSHNLRQSFGRERDIARERKRGSEQREIKRQRE